MNKLTKVLTVSELIAILKQYDGNLPCIITDEGPNHQYGVKLENIYIKDGAYFGNDPKSDEQFPYEDNEVNEIQYKFLNIGTL